MLKFQILIRSEIRIHDFFLAGLQWRLKKVRFWYALRLGLKFLDNISEEVSESCALAELGTNHTVTRCIFFGCTWTSQSRPPLEAFDADIAMGKKNKDLFCRMCIGKTKGFFSRICIMSIARVRLWWLFCHRGSLAAKLLKTSPSVF